jgi:DNA polymerase III subunit delta
MKLAGKRLEAFLRCPDPAIIAVLLYGPDSGLVRERSDALTTQIAGDASDPFRVTVLSGDELKNERGRLADETASLSFSGGRRVVRVRDAGDSALEACRLLFDSASQSGSGLAVLEAGELGPRSGLRQAFEAAQRAVAIPCYVDEGESLRRVVNEDLRAHGLTMSAGAMDVLVAHLGGNRMQTRRELEKLAVFMGGPGEVSSADVLAVVGGSGSMSLDAIVFAACSGDVPALDAGLAAAFAESAQPIPLLRAAARHLLRLSQAKAAIAGGASAAEAMNGLRPQVFFRMREVFLRQLGAWTVALIAEGLFIISQAEIDSKRTGAPQRLICERAFIDVANLSRGRV